MEQKGKGKGEQKGKAVSIPTSKIESDSLLQSIKHQPYKLEKSTSVQSLKKSRSTPQICTSRWGPAISVMTPKNWVLYPDEAGSPGDGEPWLLLGCQETEVTQKRVPGEHKLEHHVR